MTLPLVSWGPWQQCVDENTQHPYYWNTTTNEVTWTVPEEIAIQYEQIAQGSQVTSSTSAEKKGKAEKTETYLKEVSKSNYVELTLIFCCYFFFVLNNIFI